MLRDNPNSNITLQKNVDEVIDICFIKIAWLLSTGLKRLSASQAAQNNLVVSSLVTKITRKSTTGPRKCLNRNFVRFQEDYETAHTLEESKKNYLAKI